MSHPHPDKQPIGFFEALGFTVAASIATTVEAATFWFAHLQQVYVALACYAGGIGIFAVIALAQLCRRKSLRWPVYFMMLSAGSGVFGSLSCVFIPFIEYWRSSKAGAFLDLMTLLFPENERETEAEIVSRRIAFGQEENAARTDIEPFRDFIKFGSLAQKRNVIARMTRYFAPAYAPLLRQMLEDNSGAVRVQAATALAKIEQDYVQRCQNLEDEYKQNPQIKKAVALAKSYEAFAQSGIADHFTANANRQKAIEIYNKILQNEKSPVVVRALACLYWQMGPINEARSLYENYLVTIERPSQQDVLDYMNILCSLKEYSALRVVSSVHADLLKDPGSDPGQRFLQEQSAAEAYS